MATLKLRNGTTVTVPDVVQGDYISQGLTVPGDEAQIRKVSKRRRSSTPRRPRASRSKPNAATPADTKPAEPPADTPPTTPTE